MYDTFEEWFDVFVDNVRALDYHGNIDRDTFESDYENGADPMYVAKEFVDEMNS